LGDNVANTSDQPLFTYRDKLNNPTTDISSARVVDVNLILDDPTDSLPAVTRTFTYALGGVYLANQVAPGSIDTLRLVDGSVTSAKIADGAITGDKFSTGTLDPSKFTPAVRASEIQIPLISGGSATWDANSTTSWSNDPQATFDRVSEVEADYCETGKSLQARAHFVAYNQTTSDISLLMKLVRDDGQGGGETDFATTDAIVVPAHGYGDIASKPWQNITCVPTGDSSTYFYSIKTEAGNTDSISKDFTVIYAALELRYQ
jgi:hypothetical protein